jgi:hypothetical protein
MKKNKKILLFIVVAILSFGAVVYSDAVPGTDSDPLITLSYLEMRLENLGQNNEGEEVESSSLYEVLKVDQEDIILLGSSAEIILRAGKAKAFVTDKGGLADVTSGNDIGMDELIPKNHLLICPLDDGRGLVFESESWIMVKGEYTLYDNQ